MLYLSEILMQDHGLQSFQQLMDAIQSRALQGEMFFQMDVKPPFPDTPEDWETCLEVAFTEAGK